MTTTQLDHATEPYTAENWRDGAECRQADPEAFFPAKGGSNTEAKHTCLSCSVRVFCLDWAIENNIQHGVWGATSTYQRRNLRRARRNDTTTTTATGTEVPA
ncbi:MAG TPA: WhiB family transcriptional regulator [Jiangellaceae bacterium]